MPVITVVKPFGLRLGREVHSFGIGEHCVSDEEFGHWFLQACLKDGRAVRMPEPAAEGSGEEQPPARDEPEAPAAPSRGELMALTVAQLKEMAVQCGLVLASNATKAAIVDALLAGQENG